MTDFQYDTLGTTESTQPSVGMTTQLTPDPTNTKLLQKLNDEILEEISQKQRRRQLPKSSTYDNRKKTRRKIIRQSGDSEVEELLNSTWKLKGQQWYSLGTVKRGLEESPWKPTPPKRPKIRQNLYQGRRVSNPVDRSYTPDIKIGPRLAAAQRAWSRTPDLTFGSSDEHAPQVRRFRRPVENHTKR